MFELKEKETKIKKELVGGMRRLFRMVYIVGVNGGMV